MKSTPFKQMSFEEKRKAFSWYVDAIKDMKYETYKNVAERFDVSERHLRRLRSGDRNIQFKLFDRIRKSFEKLARDNYFLVVALVGQSALVTGVVRKVLTDKAAINTLARIESSQATEKVYYMGFWRQGTKYAFSLEDFKEIAKVIQDVEEKEELIFINSYDVLFDLVTELKGKERAEAQMIAYDVV